MIKDLIYLIILELKMIFIRIWRIMEKKIIINKRLFLIEIKY